MRWKPKFTREQRVKIGQFWVTSVGGTTLVIVVQTFGQDWGQWRGWGYALAWSDIDWAFTLDRWVRYGLALWFGIYIVLAYLANEARPDSSWKGLCFDVLQSLLTFVSLGVLGFVTQNFEVLRDRREGVLTVAFGAIGTIALWTFVMHHMEIRALGRDESWRKSQRPLQWIRFGVLVTACLAIGYVWCHSPKRVIDAWVLLFVCACLAELYLYCVFAFNQNSPQADIASAAREDLRGAATSLTDAGKKLKAAGEVLQSIVLQ